MSLSKSIKLVEEVAEDTVEVTAPIVAISLVSAAIFGMIDALSLLFAEKTLADALRTTGLFTESTLLLAVGGISTAAALFIAIFVEKWLAARFTLFKSPYIDASGIIIGTILVIAGVRIYTKMYPTPPKNPKKKTPHH
jgi:predicted metal-binding membrane protein